MWMIAKLLIFRTSGDIFLVSVNKPLTNKIIFCKHEKLEHPCTNYLYDKNTTCLS